MEAEPAPPDYVDREIDFIHHLMDLKLFPYADLAIKELRVARPSAENRINVVEVTLLLRLGKTDQVQELLKTKDLANDPKAQAMLLHLGMTFDAMGRNDEASGIYNQFLRLNEGKEITDPDLARSFASAALRLGVLLKEAGDFKGAASAYDRVIATAESDSLKRKFIILASQNLLDEALSLSGKAREDKMKAAEKRAGELLWGSTDNYWFMAMAIRSWVMHLEGDSQGALKSLDDMKERVALIETEMDKAGIPKSEYPRAAIRYVRGVIQWDLAKKAVADGDNDRAKKLAGSAASQLYTAFVKYEGNAYAKRAGLDFENLKGWLKTELDVDLGGPSGGNIEEIFKRQLDLADDLVRAGKFGEAEVILLKALKQYPVTKYTVGALNTLSRVWLEQNKTWEMMALATYVGNQYPDNQDASGILLRIGKRMFDEKNVFGYETVFGTFGRKYPSHPKAPAFLFQLARMAADNGDQASAQTFYQELATLYPGSKYATMVLTLRAVDALKAENYEVAIESFQQVRDQAPPGFQRAQAAMGMADAKLKSGDPDKGKEALAELKSLRVELKPDPDSVYYRGEDAAKSTKLLENVRFMVSQVLLRQAREQASPEIREEAAKELDNYLVDYPEGDMAPQVMYSLGRLLLQQGKITEATQLFFKLSQTYPESEEGKDALYALVKAAIEEGQTQVAQEAVQKMVSQAASYEVEKIFRVGQLMQEHEYWQEAYDCFQIVLKHPATATNSAYKQRALFNSGVAGLGLNSPDKAIDSLGKLVVEFPNSSLVIDAGIALSRAYLLQEPPQIEGAEKALEPVARIISSRPTALDRAKLDLAVAQILMAKGDTKKALASFYKVGLSKPESPEHGELVRTGLKLGIDAAQVLAQGGDLNQWGLVAEMADQYVRNFPMAKDANEMRALNVKAIGLTP